MCLTTLFYFADQLVFLWLVQYPLKNVSKYFQGTYVWFLLVIDLTLPNCIMSAASYFMSRTSSYRSVLVSLLRQSTKKSHLFSLGLYSVKHKPLFLIICLVCAHASSQHRPRSGLLPFLGICTLLSAPHRSPCTLGICNKYCHTESNNMFSIRTRLRTGNTQGDRWAQKCTLKLKMNIKMNFSLVLKMQMCLSLW